MLPPVAWRTGKYEVFRITASATRQRYFVVKMSLADGEHAMIAAVAPPILAFKNRDKVYKGMTASSVPLARSVPVSIPHFDLRMSLLIVMYFRKTLLTIQEGIA